jgi:hypothetical protein
VKLTPNEITIIAALLDQHSDEFSTHGCNDYQLRNTDENWALCERMWASDANLTVDAWRESDEARDRPKGRVIDLMDWELSAYLAAKLRGECD